jgi:sigma-70-like protein
VRSALGCPEGCQVSRPMNLRLSGTSIGVGCRRYLRAAMSGVDRVRERRRAAAVARHYRDEEDLSIAEIARRLGRAEATVKAYLYDPSDDNKRPTHSPQERQFWALPGHARTSICKPVLGCRCDGTRSALPTARSVRVRKSQAFVIAVPGTAPNS